MNMRKFMLATASVALVAAPVAAQANTRAAQSSVSVSPAAFTTTARSASKVDGEELVFAPLLLAALAVGGIAAAVALYNELSASNGN